MTCAKCGTPRPPANLTILANGERWCPECLYTKSAYDWQHQKLAPAPAVVMPAFHVVDVPRANAKRRSA